MDARLAKEEQMAKDLETSLGIQMDAEKQMNLDLEVKRAIEADRAAATSAPNFGVSHEPHDDNNDDVQE